MSQLTELDPFLVAPLKRPVARQAKRPAVSAASVSPAAMRWAGAIVAVGLLAACAGRITAFATEPVLATYRTGLEIRHLQQEVAREAKINDLLRQDIDYLQTPAGVEQEARRRGWVRPGEIALSVVAPDAPPAPAAAAPRGDGEPHPTSVSQRIQEALDTCLAVLGGPTERR